MISENALIDLRKDEICLRILGALSENDLTHDQVIALGGNPRQIATRLELLQATGIIEAYCAPIHPSACS